MVLIYYVNCMSYMNMIDNSLLFSENCLEHHYNSIKICYEKVTVVPA